MKRNFDQLAAAPVVSLAATTPAALDQAADELIRLGESRSG
jgi:hypothetical protein